MSTDTPPTDVNVEAIMREIREQILARKAVEVGPDQPLVKIDGKRFPADFYEHLYQAEMLHDQLQVKRFVSETNIPIIGGLVQRLRAALHQLVLFYVNQLAAQQIAVNAHLLRAISLISEEME